MIPMFGALFRQYGVEDFIGLQLLHKHFDVYEGELIVDQHDGNVSIAEPMTWDSLLSIHAPLGVIAHRFKVTESAHLIPLEFSVVSEQNSFVADAYQQLISPEHAIFLYEFSRLLAKFNLLNVFGIGLKSFEKCDTVETTTDGDRFQVTRSRQDYQTWMKQALPIQQQPLFETPVFWDFTEHDFDDQMKLMCWHCSHCGHHCGHF